MPRSRLRFTLPALFALIALGPGAVPGRACIPSPTMSSVPRAFALVGLTPAAPDSVLAREVVVVRDLSGNTVANAEVVIDFGGCPDCRVAADPARGDRYVVRCGSAGAGTASTVTTYTGPDGSAAFTILGASRGGPGTPGRASVRIFVDGVNLPNLASTAGVDFPVAIYDLDGAGGINLGDLTVWARDYFSKKYIGRSDYDGDGNLSVADLSSWAQAYFAGGSTVSAAAACP